MLLCTTYDCYCLKWAESGGSMQRQEINKRIQPEPQGQHKKNIYIYYMLL